MSEAAEKKRPDLREMLREEFNFSVRMFFAPVMAIVHEVKDRWKDVDVEVEKATPKHRKEHSGPTQP